MKKSVFSVAETSPLLKKYLDNLSYAQGAPPMYHDALTVKELNEIRKAALYDTSQANIIYYVGDELGDAYIHVNAELNSYTSVEWPMSPEQQALLEKIRSAMLVRAAKQKAIKNEEERKELIDLLFQEVVRTDDIGFVDRIRRSYTIPVPAQDLDLYRYFIHRDINGYGPLNTIMHDPYIEDVHTIGTENIHIIHKAFQYGLESNVRFPSDKYLNSYLVSLSERIGRPVTPTRPIVDGAMPDGSRINIIYSEDISRKGSSFTIRKFSAEPISCIQLVKWGTMSAKLAAYIWLCLENKMNMIFSGETASGKTTSLNAILPLIDHRNKIFSAEDTPEVKPPHDTWQRCVSRESGPMEYRVTMFDLLRAALRSRPDYLIIGEIRGEEGRVAFQAMQTGIPVLSTFHAANATKFIQRFTGDPINIPMTFIDNVNVLLFQSAVSVDGKILRRVTSVEEFVGYSKEEGGVLTKNVFKWDPVSDTHIFRGFQNSYILEEKVAADHGYLDKRKIYEELDKREAIIKKMAENDITDHRSVNEALVEYFKSGVEGLPFFI